jgi:hypothetical protein
MVRNHGAEKRPYARVFFSGKFTSGDCTRDSARSWEAKCSSLMPKANLTQAIKRIEYDGGGLNKAAAYMRLLSRLLSRILKLRCIVYNCSHAALKQVGKHFYYGVKLLFHSAFL